MARESTITPTPRGAGRVLDMCMPAPTNQVVGNNAMGSTWINRQGWNNLAVTGSYSGFGIPPAGTGWTTYKGRIAFKQTGSGTSGGFFVAGSDHHIMAPTLRSGTAFQDDFRCWRVTLIYASDTAVGTGDSGLEIGPLSNFDLRVGTGSGAVRVGPGSTPTTMSVQVSTGGGAPVFDQTVMSNTDVTEWHQYEFRLIGATDIADGTFKVLIDGQNVAAFGFGAGSILPSFLSGSIFGWRLSTGNRGQQATYVAMNGLSLIAGPDEASLL